MELSSSLVQLMINQLTTLKNTNSPLVTVIENFPLLITTLRELDSLVEMTTVKESIISQLRFLLMKQAQSPLVTHPVFEDQMLHTIIYGPPGVGKTKVGVILAKIWLSLGLLQKSKAPAKSSPSKSLSASSTGTSKSSSSNCSSKSTPTPTSTLISIPQVRSTTITELIDPTNMSLVISGKEKEKEKGDSMSTVLEELYEKIINKMEAKNKVTTGRINRLKQHLHLQENRYNQLYRELEKLKYRQRFLSRNQESNIFNLVDESLLDLEIDLKMINEELLNDRDLRNVITKTIADTFISFPAPDKPSNKTPNKSPDKTSDTSPIKIINRSDLVAEYLGQTAIKTLNLLQQNVGKVVFIDEAYSLVTSDRDSFGMESLTIINQFMSEHPNEIVIIFSGYKDLLEKTIFEKQPGLKRRCTWVFEISGYSAKGLAEIFHKQLAEFNWSLDQSIDLIAFFSRNKEYFPSFGGDTSKLSFYCKLAYASEIFTDYTITTTNPDINTLTEKIITEKMLHIAFNNYKQNRVKESNEGSPIPGIYL